MKSNASSLQRKLWTYGLGSIAVAQRILLELWRRKMSLLCWAVFPASILLVNGFILAKPEHMSLGTAFAETLPACLVGTALFFSCLGGSIATLVAEREQGTLRRLLISPLQGTAYFLGIFIAYGSIGIGQTLLVYTIASLMGAEFQGSAMLSLIIIVLSMILYVGAGFCIGTTLAQRTEEVNALIAALGVPLLLLSGAFIPIEFFPDFLLTLAKYNPIYHMIAALHLNLIEGKSFDDLGIHFAILLIFSVGTLGFGWFSYRQMLSAETH